jgi:hypothetical protein
LVLRGNVKLGKDFNGISMEELFGGHEFIGQRLDNFLGNVASHECLERWKVTLAGE